MPVRDAWERIKQEEESTGKVRITIEVPFVINCPKLEESVIHVQNIMEANKKHKEKNVQVNTTLDP